MSVDGKVSGERQENLFFEHSLILTDSDDDTLTMEAMLVPVMYCNLFYLSVCCSACCH